MFRKQKEMPEKIKDIMAFLQLDPKEFSHPFADSKVISSLFNERTARARALPLQALLCQLNEKNADAIYVLFAGHQSKEVLRLEIELANTDYEQRVTHHPMLTHLSARVRHIHQDLQELRMAYIVIDVRKIQNMERLVLTYTPRL